MTDRQRSLGGPGVILIALICMLGTMMAPVPACAQEPETVLYQENFDGQAQDWELEPGWQVIQDGDNWVLAGEGHQWARPDSSYDSDFRVQFRLKLLQGRIHLVYRLNQTGRYFIGFQEDGSDLHKQYWPETFLHGLAGSTTPHTLGGWHQVEIVGQGASLRFLVDGQVEWEYTDHDPLAGGSFAFEALDDSAAYVDDILVYGPAPTPTPTPDRRFTWVRTGGPLGGLGYDVRLRPDNPDVMVVTDAWAGFFMSTDGGEDWFPSNQGITTRIGPTGDGIPVFCATIDPSNPDTIWVGTQSQRGIFKSTDGGKTWKKMDSGVVERDGITFRGFTIDPHNSDIVYAAAELSSWVWNNGQPRTGREFDMTAGVVYKTTDGGQSWEAVWRGQNLARYIWIDPRDSNVIYVSTGIFDREAANSDPVARKPGGEGLLKSTDGGQTWTHINNGLDNLYVGSLFMHPTNPDILLAATGNVQYRQNGGVYLTTDGGALWTRVLQVYDDMAEVVEFSTSNPSIAYAASLHDFCRSEDGGRTWKRMSGGSEDGWGPPGVRAGIPIDLQADPRDPDRVFANAYGGGNFLSEDGGRNWRVASKGYTGALTRDVAVDPTQPGRVIVAGRSGLFVSYNGGSDWEGLNYPPVVSSEWTAIAIDPSNPQHLLAGINWGNNLVSSEDGGYSWRILKRFESEQVGWHTVVFAPSDPSVVYAGTAGYYSAGMFDPQEPGRGVYVSYDGGQTWKEANDATTRDAYISSLAVDPTEPQVVYIATPKHGLLKTTDGGQTWVELEIPAQSEGMMSVAINPADPNTVFAGLWQGGVYRSTDGGTTWEHASNGLNPEASISDIIFDPANPTMMYLADAFSGVYRSMDGGKTWRATNDGLTMRSVNAFAISTDGQHLYAASEGSGVFRLDLSGQPPQPVPAPTLPPTPTPVPTVTPPPATPTPTAVAAVPTVTPQLAALPPKPTPEPQAKRGICPGVVALSLALLSLVLYRNRGK